MKREGEYPTPVYHSVVALTQGHDLYSLHSVHILTAMWLPSPHNKSTTWAEPQFKEAHCVN